MSIQLTAGMRTNLLSLQKTQSSMELTQSRLATGLRVQSALDDPINYFAAKGHNDRAGDLAFRKEEMAEGVQLLKATDNGIEGVLDLIASAKSLAQSARSAETTQAAAALGGQYDAVMTQITNLASDAGYKGVNLMTDSTTTLVVGFDETATSKVTLTAMELMAGTGAGDNMGIGVSAGSAGNLPPNLEKERQTCQHTVPEQIVTNRRITITRARGAGVTALRTENKAWNTLVGSASCLDVTSEPPTATRCTRFLPSRGGPRNEPASPPSRQKDGVGTSTCTR